MVVVSSVGIPVLRPKTLGRRALIHSFYFDCSSLVHDGSYAEMEAAEKNKISHRGRALEKLVAYLRTLPIST